MRYADHPHFHRGIRACIAWLHKYADEMNDPHARTVLHCAAFSLGVDKPDPELAVADTTDRSAMPRDEPTGTITPTRCR